MKYVHPNLKIIVQLDFNRNEARLERNETIAQKVGQFNNEHVLYARTIEGRQRGFNTWPQAPKSFLMWKCKEIIISPKDCSLEQKMQSTV